MTEPTTPLDLDAIRPWLGICGGCDLGIGDCTHPDGDYRSVMADLLAEVDRLRADVERLRQHILDIDAHATPCGDIPDEPGPESDPITPSTRRARISANVLREYADKYHHFAGGHGPISTPSGWIDPDAWCVCGAAWSDDDGGCTERVSILAYADRVES